MPPRPRPWAPPTPPVRAGWVVAAAAVAVALVALCRPAAAQRSPGALSRLSVGVGGDARGAADGDGFGRSLLVGYDVGGRVGGLPIAARLTGTLLDRSGPAAASTRYGGLGLDLTLPLGPAGGVRPYLLAGAGAYRLREVPASPAGPVGSGPRAAARAEARTAAALVGGAGVRVPVGRASLFAEARYTAFRAAGTPSSYVPVVVGLHF